jgi:hypothetical protein
MEKQYVPVVVRIDECGKKDPKIIEFENRKYKIEKILDRGPAACYSVGGVGIKYTCVVLGKITELWEEKDQWFVVRK